MEVLQIKEVSLKNHLIPDFVWDEYHLDSQINRSILIDQ